MSKDKPEATLKPVIQAIDLGWGWTKATKYDADGNITYFSFPSLAPRHAGVDLSMSILGRRDTVVVTVEGTEYEVGPDSVDLDGNDASRNLNDQYIYSDQYRAVLYGALHYMGMSSIDLLVVGLPLSSMHMASKLKELVEGTHDLNSFETVTVKEALVLPQPMGALYYCLSRAKQDPRFEWLKEERNLIIDPGYLTFDFLFSNGDKIVENRSSAHVGGVSKVLRAVAESISLKHGIRYENLSAIDSAIRRGKFKINGTAEDIGAHLKHAYSVAEASVTYMKNIVGDGSDIDNIILVGGGSHIYKDAVAAAYKNHEVIVLEDPQMANIHGFQLAGEQFYKAR